MFDLPQELISLIYEYDNTYHNIYDNCLKDMIMNHINHELLRYEHLIHIIEKAYEINDVAEDEDDDDDLTQYQTIMQKYVNLSIKKNSIINPSLSYIHLHYDSDTDDDDE